MDYSKIAELKKFVEEKHGQVLHFHDTCGSGVYFSLDKKNEDIEKFLTEYFEKLGKKIKISENGLTISAE